MLQIIKDTNGINDTDYHYDYNKDNNYDNSWSSNDNTFDNLCWKYKIAILLL